MAETMVITWGKDEISLKLLESTGVWSEDFPPIKTIAFPKPTRISRITNFSKRREIAAAISDLLEDIDLDQPLWLLIPISWIIKMRVIAPEIQSTELRLQHIEWEAAQKLHGDKSIYNLQVIDHADSEIVEVRVIRTDLLESLNSIIESVNLNAAGITVEPTEGEDYSFETPHDLRESTPFGSDDELSVKPHRSSIIPVSAGITIVAIAVAGWYWTNSSSNDPVLIEKIVTENKGTQKQPKSSPKDAASAETDQDAASSLSESAAKKEAGVKGEDAAQPAIGRPEASLKPPPQMAQQRIFTGKSPLKLLRESLTQGAVIEFAAISPMDMRVEISGLTNPNGWTKNIQQSPGLERVIMSGKFTDFGKKITVLQFSRPGFTAGNGERNIRSWRKKAVSEGLTASGRTARGSANNAFRFVETMWNDMNGFSKVYLAHDRTDWVVTVQ